MENFCANTFGSVSAVVKEISVSSCCSCRCRNRAGRPAPLTNSRSRLGIDHLRSWVGVVKAADDQHVDVRRREPRARAAGVPRRAMPRRSPPAGSEAGIKFRDPDAGRNFLVQRGEICGPGIALVAERRPTESSVCCSASCFLRQLGDLAARASAGCWRCRAASAAMVCATCVCWQ